jgi:hypothetical protein
LLFSPPDKRAATLAEVLVQLDPPVTDEAGRTYVVRICGRAAENGLWEGWIEFEPEDGGLTLRTPRETEQLDRADLKHWATGLTLSYLEGALERARHPEKPDLRPRTVVVGRPTYEGPAPSAVELTGTAVPHGLAAQLPGFEPAHGEQEIRVPPRAALNPYRVYARQGEIVLRTQLGALDEAELRKIIRAYEVVGEEAIDVQAMHHPSLVELIVAAMRKLYPG